MASGFFGESLTLVGKPAPPIPTTPAALILSKITSLVRSSNFIGVYSTSLNSPSFSIMIELHLPPVANVLGSIALTVPDTDE